MRDIPELVDGYRRFLDTRYAEQSTLYRTLAEAGQKPKTMIIACCDSRADPAMIFSASPGQFFIVRNVANLVPPFEPHGDYHGTSAALEFAVTGLNIENIVVMGHGRCGGVRAYLDGLYAATTKPGFIDKWLTLLHPARADALQECTHDTVEGRQQALEWSSVKHSLENLQTFPFVRERLEARTLRLRGAYFDISDGKLLSLDPETGKFEPVF